MLFLYKIGHRALLEIPFASSPGYFRRRDPRGVTPAVCCHDYNMHMPWRESGYGSWVFANEQGRCAWHHQAEIGDLGWGIPCRRRSSTAGPMWPVSSTVGAFISSK
jgi:hypothetical protein